MANKIQINKTVYNKQEYDKIIDRTFKTFGVEEIQPTEITIPEFFQAYEDLYYEIPIQGEEQTHEYLIKKSSELIEFEKDTLDIQPLLDEIAELRQQILDNNTELIQLRSQLAERGGV